MTTTPVKVPPAPVSVTVPAQELRRALAAVLPHTGRDDTLPSLTCVRFEITAGWLYLAATDRYSMAAARIQVPAGDQGPGDAAWLLPRRPAKALRRMLKGSGAFATVTFTAPSGTWPAPDGSLSVAADGGTAGTWATEPGEFPKWQGMLDKLLAAPAAELSGPARVDARMLARFTVPAGSGSYESGLLAVRFAAGGTKAGVPAPIVVVTRGAWFCGVLLTVRQDSEDGPAAGPWAAVTTDG